MPSLKDIRRRISSVKNTQKITRAMKLVAAAKLRRAQDAMTELRPYASKFDELLTSLVKQGAAEGDVIHPLLEKREVKRSPSCASSDRGMCGGFNSNAQRALQLHEEVWQARFSGDGDFPVGRRMVQHVSRRGYKVGTAYENIISLVDNDEIGLLAREIQNGFVSGEFDEVVLIKTL